jgi:hypothetical protein
MSERVVAIGLVAMECEGGRRWKKGRSVRDIYTPALRYRVKRTPGT